MLQKDLEMRNYYTLNSDELKFWINEIRHWLFANPKHPRTSEVEDALEVALSAQKLQQLKEGSSDLGDLSELFSQT